MPMTVGAMVLSEPIVRILFQRGAFDTRATQMTAVALIFYSIGLIGVGLRDILTKIFYSVQDTKTPMINATIAVVMNICMNLLFIKYLKHAGLALATMAQFHMSEDLFPDAPKEDQESLREFTFICMLCLDIYIKKQVIEAILDKRPKTK